MTSNPLTQEEIDGLSPGIRDLVVWLNKSGFETTDSGDGSNHEDGMECASPYPMVAIEVPDKEHLIHYTDRLYDMLIRRGVEFGNDDDSPAIQASYNPEDGYPMIVVINVLSEDVQLKEGP